MFSIKMLPVAGIIFLATACTEAPESDKAVTSEAVSTDSVSGIPVAIDASTSNIEWVGTKVSGYHSGEIKIKSGELLVDDGNLVGGNFTIDMPSMTVTGPDGVSEEMNQKLLGHLKSGDFFEVEKHPEATFTITSVAPFTGSVNEQEDARQASISEYKVANPTHTISGNLNIKGINKNISFPAKLDVTENKISALAKFNIDRTEWNIIYPGQPDDLIRNEIHLGISINTAR